MSTQIMWDVTLCRGTKRFRRLHSQGHADQKDSSNVDDCLL